MADTPIHPSAPLRRRKPRHRKIHARPRSQVSTGAARADLNVTPLVDVVLVLLIIFMVVTPLLHRGVKIDLPETEHHAQIQDTGEQLIVSVRQDGVYIDTDRVGDVPEMLNGKLKSEEITQKQLDSMHERFKKELRDGSRAAFVRANRSLKYGQVRFAL